ncbi:hypothetical protein BX666DRAFT_1584020 [Dichotomocladium elegans]|nr:hypothetical protein BX666DRAFT_1584020 [Dichotomocladium elegans]
MKDPKDYMQQQIDQLLNQNAQLQCRLSKAQDAYAAAENKAQTLQARNNLLELARCSSGKAYEEIIQVYEKQGAACQRQVEEAIALDSQSQAEIESLRELTDRMRKALNKSEIQLIALKKQQQQRRDGSSANDNVAIGSVQQGDPVCTLTAPSESNYSLAKFILAYEDEGKEWFNVFSELFNLREAHVNVLTQKENLHAVYQKLLDDMKHIQRNLSQRENDMATLQAELAKTKKENETLQVENNGSKNKVEEQNKTIARKQQQIEELHGALNATSYQLRETLRHTELEKKLLPLDIQKTADLLERATLVTDVDHDLLAFQSVDELQQRNAELVQEVRGLNHTLKAKASEIAALKRQHKAETKMLTNKLQEACTHICQSQLTIDTLKERLSEGYATLLPERLPKDIPMHRVKFGAELEALEKELDDARAAANASAIKAQNLHEELDLCKDQYKLLEQTSESRLQELKKLHIANGDLQIELNDSKNALQLCKNDLAILQTEKLALTEENNKLQVQVTASEQLYQESMTIKNAREAHIDQMAALIRERTSKMDINNKSSLEVIDYHKQLAKSQQVEIDSLDAELRTAKADLEELNHSNEIYAQRLEALQTENSRLKEENARVLYEEASLKEAKAILELKVLKYEEELTPERLTHNQKVADDLAAAQVELEALQSQAIEYNKKLQENEDTINKINQDRHKFALNVEAKFKELQGALESYREREKTMETAAKEIEKIRNEKVQVELGWQNEKTAHAAELQALQEKHDAQEIKNQALLQEIESYVSLARESKEQLARLRHELDEREANDQTENLKQEIEQLKKDLSEAQGDLATTKTQLETVQTQFEARESEWDTEFSSLRAELNKRRLLN